MEEGEEMWARYAQGHSIFQTQFKCRGKVCKVVVSSGSLENIVSIEMVEKLNLPRKPLESPYRAYGVSNDQWVDVKEQAYVSFSIGSYYDTILCDIIP